MKIEISMKDASWRYSKLSGLRMMDWLCGLGAGRASRAMKKIAHQVNGLSLVHI